MLSTTREDLGRLLLRVLVGGLMLFHGVAKLKEGGIAGIEGMLVAKNLPAMLSYGVYVGELLAPLLIVLGLFTRLSSAVFAFNMAVAVFLAHAGDFGLLTPHGGWALELQAFYFFGAIAIILLGPGNFSLDATRKRPPSGEV